eukprot:3564805-Pleurochrysis_carterae.AAC.1
MRFAQSQTCERLTRDALFSGKTSHAIIRTRTITESDILRAGLAVTAHASARAYMRITCNYRCSSFCTRVRQRAYMLAHATLR